MSEKGQTGLTVSVALCTYNGSRHILEQLSSILGQTRLPEEIVVSDDASTDGTESMVRDALAAAGDRGIAVRLLGDGIRRGVSANFALAIGACTADMVVLSDQDDVWHPRRIEAAVEAFRGDPTLMMRHENARLVDERGRPLGVTLYGALAVTPDDRAGIDRGAAFPVYLRRNLATGATMSFRRALFDRAAPIPDEWVHDEWLAIVASTLGRVDASDDILVDYRQHGSNVIGVTVPTFGYRVRRMLGSEQSRNRALATRSRILAERLASMTGVSRDHRSSAAAKARFELARAALPASRVRRLPGILRIARGGQYHRFASQGRLDMVRDLVQRAT